MLTSGLEVNKKNLYAVSFFFVLVPFILILNTFIFFYNLKMIQTAQRELESLQTQMTQLQAFVEAVRDTESQQRKYLITGSNSDLTIYNSSKLSLQKHFSLIRQQGFENVMSNLFLRKITNDYEGKISQMDALINIRMRQGFPSVQKVMLSDFSSIQYNSANKFIKSLWEIQNINHETYSNALKKSKWLLSVSFFVTLTMGFGLFLIIFIYRNYKQDAFNKKRDSLNQNIKEPVASIR